MAVPWLGIAPSAHHPIPSLAGTPTEYQLQDGIQVAWGPVSTVLVHQNEVRGLYAEGLLGRWEGGRVAAKVRLPDDRAEIATDGEQFLVWKGKTAWLVDGDCRVVWKAEFANRLAIGEGFALGVRCGADPAVLYEVVKNASGQSRMLDSRAPGFLLDGSFQPGFKLDLMKKDVNLALESARALNVPLLLGGAAGQLFAAASSAGRGGEDFSAAAEFLAGLAAATLRRRRET